MFLVALCGVCGMMTVVVVRCCDFFWWWWWWFPQIKLYCVQMYIVGYGSNSGNVGGQAKQGKDGIYILLITTPTNIREIQISSCIHRSSPFHIRTFFFRTGVVENSFTTNIKLGHFTAAHAQTQVAVKNK